jgi:acetyl-CoA carboxylase carboxyl transferase subunit alpha
MRITARDLLEHRLIDEIIPEPLGGAHRNPPAIIASVKDRLVTHFDRLGRVPMTQLLGERYQRLMNVGAFEEPKQATAAA